MSDREKVNLGAKSILQIKFCSLISIALVNSSSSANSKHEPDMTREKSYPPRLGVLGALYRV